MKAKCEEIIIDQYLKGNITNEEKNRHLGFIDCLKEERKELKALYITLTQNPEEFLEDERVATKTYKKIINKNIKTFVDDHNLHHLSLTEQQTLFFEDLDCLCKLEKEVYGGDKFPEFIEKLTKKVEDKDE